MSKFFDDTMQGLLEAVAINQKQIPVQKVDGLQTDTFRVEDIESNLIDSVVKIRKESNISQKELADLTESKQQSISRFEKKMHSPSLILFVSLSISILNSWLSNDGYNSFKLQFKLIYDPPLIFTNSYYNYILLLKIIPTNI